MGGRSGWSADRRRRDDAHRHPWQQAVAALVGAGGAVVVDVGLPVTASFAGANGVVTTCGAGRVNLEAAREALIG